MIVEYKWDDILRRSSLHAAPQDYDGHPSPARLSCEWVPRTLPSTDRLAVAGALAFARSISGSFSVGSSVSKPTADALRSFFGNRRVELDEASLRPQEPKRGTTAFLLGIGDTYIPEIGWHGFDEPRQIAFIDYRSSARAGASFDFASLEAPSNAWLFRRDLDVTDISYWYPQTALAILFAEDFEVGEIWFPSEVSRDSRYTALVELLKSIDLSVGRSARA